MSKQNKKDDLYSNIELIPDEAITVTIEKDLSKGLDYRKISVEEQ